MKTERDEETAPFPWSRSWASCSHQTYKTLAGEMSGPRPSAEDPSHTGLCAGPGQGNAAKDPAPPSPAGGMVAWGHMAEADGSRI